MGGILHGGLMLALIFLAGCRKQESGSKAAAAPAAPPVEGALVLTAEVAEIPGTFPANDLYNYAYIMKYKVVEVHKGEYADPDILVGHYNPRMTRMEVKDDQDAKVGGNAKSFQVGDRHYLVLDNLDGIWSGAIEDEYYKDRRKRYWALWADKL